MPTAAEFAGHLRIFEIPMYRHSAEEWSAARDWWEAGVPDYSRGLVNCPMPPYYYNYVVAWLGLSSSYGMFKGHVMRRGTRLYQIGEASVLGSRQPFAGAT